MELLLLDNSRFVRKKIGKITKPRKCWVNDVLKQRKEFGEFHHLHNDLKNNPELFKDYYRMKPETFNYILAAIESSIQRFSNFRETITPEEKLSITIRYLATGCSFKTLGYSFRICDVTVGRIVKNTCDEIWKNLYGLHMPFPKSEEMKPIIQGFWGKWGFPNCVGCIDGKHIRINNPRYSGSMYRNYKQFFSIILQAVAGPDYRFISVHVGGYGKESDGGVFTHSSLSKKIEKGALGVNNRSPLPGTEIMAPHVLLGDEAYPLKTYLMRPFPVTKLGPNETIFNKRLSKARQVVECAFGIMSSKWRVLQTCILIQKPDDIDKIVKCICLLHNLLIEKEGETVIHSSDIGDTSTNNEPKFSSVGENRAVRAAYAIREEFKTFFCSNTI